MALPRKGTRKIDVDGLAYRWTVTGSDTLELYVELWNQPQGFLAARFLRHDTAPAEARWVVGEGIGAKQTRVVAPAQVACVVRCPRRQTRGTREVFRVKSFLLILLLALCAGSATASPRLEVGPRVPVCASEDLSLARDFQAAEQETCCELIRLGDPSVREPFWAADCSPPKPEVAHRPVVTKAGEDGLVCLSRPEADPASPRDPPNPSPTL